MNHHPCHQKQDPSTRTPPRSMHRRQWNRLCLLAVVVCLSASACLGQSSFTNLFDQLSSTFKGDQGGETVTDVLAQAWQEDIDQMRSLLNAQQLPTYLMEENPQLRGDEFDIMQVFSILDHIQVMEGYQLAYVYHYDGMGGYPILYAYEEDQQPYKDMEAYLTARPDCRDRKSEAPHCAFLPYIVTDGSELGYLQLILLDQLGEQFYLYWHAGYRDRFFIATQAGLEQTIEGVADPFIPMTGAQKRQAKGVDVTPQVVIGKEQVEIRAVWFTFWGGFFESRYTLNKAHPHLILDVQTQNLVEYDCGIMF